MKKVALILLLSVVCGCVAFAACVDEPADDPFDLSTKEVGYEIPVYPDCEFIYVVNDEVEITISEITATLVKLNEIKPSAILSEPFYACVVFLTAKGKTDASHAGKGFRIDIVETTVLSTVEGDGTIIWEAEIQVGDFKHFYPRFRRVVRWEDADIF